MAATAATVATGSNDMRQKVRVAVIGGGPGGMFLCHAIQQQMKQQGKNGDSSGVDVEVTCFEKAPVPGGVWRPSVENLDDDDDDEVEEEAPWSTKNTLATGNTRIYDELWTNGIAHAIEFYDYTFDEHFEGEPVPMYLPRKDVQEYIAGRMTKYNPTFFEDYFQCGTEVVHATFDEASQYFHLQLRDVTSQSTTTRVFDKCIWAGGENGSRNIPSELKNLFLASLEEVAPAGLDVEGLTEEKKEEDDPALSSDSALENRHKNGASTESVSSMRPTENDDNDKNDAGKPSSTRSTTGATPKLLHSTETTEIQRLIARSGHDSARILLIGGGFSAEDLALQCLKWGAAHVDISTRDGESTVGWTSSWPGNKVHVHQNVAVQAVRIPTTTKTAEESDQKYFNAIDLGRVMETWPNGYETVAEEGLQGDGKPAVTLTNIDMVVFCTGYKSNVSMLDESLRPSNGAPNWYMGMEDEFAFSVPKDWEMNTNNPAYELTVQEDISPGQGRMLRMNYNHPDLHRGILLSNPNMMFLSEHGSDTPLLSLDVHAWLLASYMTGRVARPTVDELRQSNYEQVLDQLHFPSLRYYMDEGYAEVLDEIPDGSWTVAPGTTGETYGWDTCESDYVKYSLRLMARVMEEGDYPGVRLGTYEELNEDGRALYDFGMRGYYCRTETAADQEGCVSDKENSATQTKTTGATFRDNADQADGIYSLYTKTKARPLKKRWMEAIGVCSVRDGDV